jgi:hypothetical protein
MEEVFDRILAVNLVCSTLVFYAAARLYVLPRLSDWKPRSVVLPILRRRKSEVSGHCSNADRAPQLKAGVRRLCCAGGKKKMRIAFALFILVICASGMTHAQSCNPAVVSSIVHDEKGKLLSETELKPVYEQLPKSIGDASTFLGEVSFAQDGRSFYRPESVDWDKGKKVPALQFINSATCTMHLTEVTLVYHQKRMRLIFNLDIARSQSDRRPVIDSPPFQNGTFELDLSGWRAGDQMIPSTRWKRLKTKHGRHTFG